MKVVYAEQARQDISSIYDFLLNRSPAVAPQVEAMIRAQCERLADFPKSGAPTTRKGIRRLPLVRYPYTIFYGLEPNGYIVEVLRVVHGARVKNLRKIPKT